MQPFTQVTSSSDPPSVSSLTQTSDLEGLSSVGNQGNAVGDVAKKTRFQKVAARLAQSFSNLRCCLPKFPDGKNFGKISNMFAGIWNKSAKQADVQQTQPNAQAAFFQAGGARVTPYNPSQSGVTDEIGWFNDSDGEIDGDLDYTHPASTNPVESNTMKRNERSASDGSENYPSAANNPPQPILRNIFEAPNDNLSDLHDSFSLIENLFRSAAHVMGVSGGLGKFIGTNYQGDSTSPNIKGLVELGQKIHDIRSEIESQWVPELTKGNDIPQTKSGSLFEMQVSVRDALLKAVDGYATTDQLGTLLGDANKAFTELEGTLLDLYIDGQRP